MKNISTWLFPIMFITLLVSCKEEDLTEYPGSLIKHGNTFLTLPKKDAYTGDDRFYAFSGSATTDLSSLSGTDYTYEFWVKVASDCPIGDREMPAGFNAGGACISERRNNFELYLVNDPSGGDFAIKYGRLNATNDFQQASMMSDASGIHLHFNEWVHVAISRNITDGIAKLYINGNLAASSTDSVWIHPVNDTWLDINYMYRAQNMNFFVGSFDLYRVSKIDRYPTNFTPNRDVKYTVDDNTLLQLNLDKHLTAFVPATAFDKIETFGYYTYFIKLHNTVLWEVDPDIYFPLYP
jgi:hypothetical protein